MHRARRLRFVVASTRGKWGTRVTAGVAALALGAAVGAAWRAGSAGADPEQPVFAPPEAPTEPLDAVLATAQRAMLDNRPEQAAAVLEAAANDWPRDPEIWRALARVRTRLVGDDANALDAFARVIESGGATAEDFFQGGTAAHQAGEAKQAIEWYREAFARSTRDARPLLFEAQVLIELDRLDEAMTALTRATEIAPFQAIAWGSLAEVQLRLDDPTASLESIARARQLEPRVAAWRTIEARAHLAMDQPAAALDALAGVEGVDRLSLPVVRLHARAAEAMGRADVAAQRFIEAAQSKRTDAALWLEAAQWVQAAGDTQAARQLAQHAAMLGSEEAAELVRTLDGDP